MSERVVILGAGESGTGAALLAKAKGFDVFVSDQGEIKDKYKAELKAADILFEDNQHTEDKILNASFVIKSPGIPLKAEIVQCEVIEIARLGVAKNLIFLRSISQPCRGSIYIKSARIVGLSYS